MNQRIINSRVAQSSRSASTPARATRQENQITATKWIDNAIIVCLFLFAAAAPNSIAATQVAWMMGMVLWLVRFAFYPPPKLYRTPVDYALFAFFLLSGLSSFLSYQPILSIGKLRGASLFTIVYLVVENIRSRRVLRLLALTLLAACMVNVIYTIGQRAIGRGIKVQNLIAGGPLEMGVLAVRGAKHPVPINNGDTLLEVDRNRLWYVEDLAAALDGPSGSQARIKIYRTEWIGTLEVPRGKLLSGATPEEQLGILSWTRGRDWRASGFYGHYVTYAEALQLIIALLIGLVVSLPSKRNWTGMLLILSLGGFIAALLLTVTRASWLAFLISTVIIVLLGARRRTILILGAFSIPLILVGLFVLQQKRHVSFFDGKDDSIVWRETVWRQGFDLLVSKPRHLLFGVGMDSIKGHWREWGLFDNGRQPVGHMHSNLLQIALERGVPALIVWLMLLAIYARTLWRLNRAKEGDGEKGRQAEGETGGWGDGGKPVHDHQWIDRGIALGALGGLVGFFCSGLVHYNWGDSEVVMIFYFIMGLSLVLYRDRVDRIDKIQAGSDLVVNS